MNFRIALLFVTLFLLSLTQNANAQLNDYEIKGGLKLNIVLPQTDFENDPYEFSYLVRGFLRFELSRYFETEVNAGFGTIQGPDKNNSKYKTNLIPIDFRFLFSPFTLKNVNPYAYAGVGAIHHSVSEKPISISPDPVEKEGWNAYVPFGLGIEVKLSEAIALDISGGYNFTFTDDLNFFNNRETGSDGSNAFDGYYEFAIGVSMVGGSGDSDADNDGLSSNDEEKFGTDPNNPDTDGDNLKDGDEIKLYNTSPLKSDGDGDGLNDHEEIKLYKTDPNSSDTDQDGISDGDELLKYSTNPLNNDTDSDELNDGDELNKYFTLPTNADTDQDGLEDGKEITLVKSDPNKKDTDNDGIIDGDEVNMYATSPLKADTDGGTVEDFIEIQRGTNPKNPKDDVILDAKKVSILEGLSFAKNSDQIQLQSEAILQKVLNTLKVYPEMRVEIRGYTDSDGDRYYNMQLSQKRADAVRNWLINRGISPSRVRAIGYGPDNPIVPNSSPENKAKNRRIEFVNISG